jgi:transcription elongation factor GreB
MSKAFTREDSGAEEADDSESPELRVPAGSKNYMTPAGAERLKAELKKLLHQERPDLVKVIQWAAGNGDRSENGDYIYGKRRLREIDRRIRFLTKRLEGAEIVDPLKQSPERVLFGATVSVLDKEGREKRFRIVGIDETDVKAGKVSWVSPIAKALLNGKVGDTVALKTPRGEEELEILRIAYETID